MEIGFSLLDKTYKITVEKGDGSRPMTHIVQIDDKKYTVGASSISKNCISALINDKSYCMYIAKAGEEKHPQDNSLQATHYVFINGEYFVIKKSTALAAEETPSATTAKRGEKILAPMPGSTVKVLVKEGDAVKKKQALIIIESMKMEMNLAASVDGKVKKIHTSDGKVIKSGELLLETE